MTWQWILVLLEETYCVGMASFCYFFRHFKPGVLLLFLRGKKLGSSFGVRSGCILDYIFIEISWLFKRVTGKPTNSLYTRATQNYKKKNKKKQTYKKLQYFQSYNLVNTWDRKSTVAFCMEKSVTLDYSHIKDRQIVKKKKIIWTSLNLKLSFADYFSSRY